MLRQLALNDGKASFDKLQLQLDQLREVQFVDTIIINTSRESLPQILTGQHSDESFQFELIKQMYFNYDYSEHKFKEATKTYLLPSIYPAAPIQKQKILTKICKEYKESIGFKWKDSDLNFYSNPHTDIFNKCDLMEFLSDFTQKFHFKLKLFLMKRSTIE
ncbi:unnamed protein product [Paramecium sonneborni]|uniref:Uncharacterized protein n=1 Tax=Paramecium sonneborni TaxID=65129 RepID=A0A8S1RSK1_9CILI|nr:unnamed protein product [Paramecium sonneborni]